MDNYGIIINTGYKHMKVNNNAIFLIKQYSLTSFIEGIC